MNDKGLLGEKRNFECSQTDLCLFISAPYAQPLCCRRIVPAKMVYVKPCDIKEI